MFDTTVLPAWLVAVVFTAQGIAKRDRRPLAALIRRGANPGKRIQQLIATNERYAVCFSGLLRIAGDNIDNGVRYTRGGQRLRLLRAA